MFFNGWVPWVLSHCSLSFCLSFSLIYWTRAPWLFSLTCLLPSDFLPFAKKRLLLWPLVVVVVDGFGVAFFSLFLNSDLCFEREDSAPAKRRGGKPVLDRSEAPKRRNSAVWSFRCYFFIRSLARFWSYHHCVHSAAANKSYSMIINRKAVKDAGENAQGRHLPLLWTEFRWRRHRLCAHAHRVVS